jgi:hypothetical protein
MAELCRLLEQSDTQILPDAIWLGGERHIYEHLRSMEALAVAQALAPSILCPDCTSRSIQPVLLMPAKSIRLPYRAHCSDCGWVSLSTEQSRLWHIRPAKIAEWLNAALGLKERYKVEMVVDGVLWYLGDREIRRQRRSFFFGCRIASASLKVKAALDQLTRPGAELLITTSDQERIKATELADRQFLSLRAIAQLRKSHLVVENIEPYLTGLATVEQSDETSLRLLHSQRAALINSQKISVSPQVHDFLTILEEADGDEVHKRHIASKLGIATATFRTADIFKRHKQVQAIFVGNDNNGNYWINPEFLILEGGEASARDTI